MSLEIVLNFVQNLRFIRDLYLLTVCLTALQFLLSLFRTTIQFSSLLFFIEVLLSIVGFLYLGP